MKLSMVVVAALGLASPATASAQDSLEVGDRVRVRVAGERSRVVGWVTSIDGDSLELSLDDVATRRGGGCRDRAARWCARTLSTTDLHPLRLGLRELSNAERAVGAHRNTLQFGLALGLVGGVAGAAAVSCLGCEDVPWYAGAVGIGGLSFLVGAAVGYLIISDEWQEVAVPLGRASRTGSMPRFILGPAFSSGRDGGVDLTWSFR